jgi:hypothetical protein
VSLLYNIYIYIYREREREREREIEKLVKFMLELLYIMRCMQPRKGELRTRYMLGLLETILKKKNFNCMQV